MVGLDARGFRGGRALCLHYPSDELPFLLLLVSVQPPLRMGLCIMCTAPCHYSSILCTASLHAVLTVASPTPPPPAHLYPCMQVHCGCTSSSLSLSSGSCPESTAAVPYHTPPLMVFVSAQLAPRADGLEMTCASARGSRHC